MLSPKQVILTLPSSEKDFRPGVLAELAWLLKEANRLSDHRNDAIHAPLVFITHPDKIELTPFIFFGDPRASRLVTKNLLDEFAWYRGRASVLAHYAELSPYLMQYPDYPWPERPKLPPLAKSRQAKRPNP
jgi:hypothetical protein